MAHIYNRRQALEKEVKDLYAKVTIGATGAPTLTLGIGIASIARNGAGDYTVTLQDKYPSLKFFEGVHLKSAAEDLNFQLKAESVASNKTVRFLTVAGASATDPANGDVLYLKFELKNTTIE
jgi:hypothetical protein